MSSTDFASSCNNSFSTISYSKNFKLESLTRYEKGYLYEMEIQSLLNSCKVEYVGNSTNFKEWRKHTETGYDVKIKKPKTNLWLRVECKFILKPVYHSWFLRDWFSRRANIIVTNNPFALSYKDRIMLRRNGKRLFSTTDFLVFLRKLMKRGNKYYLNKYQSRSPSNTSTESSKEKTSNNPPNKNEDPPPNNDHIHNSPTPFNSDTNAIKPRDPQIAEDKKATLLMMYDKYRYFSDRSQVYCKVCRFQCELYFEKLDLYKDKITGKQAFISSENVPLDYSQQKKELRLLRENRFRRKIDLNEACRKCANQRLYLYEILGYKNLFDSPEDFTDIPEPKRKVETEYPKECCHRMEIRCIQKREPVDFCTCKIPREDKKKLIAFFEKNKNECNCNEISLKHCPFNNACEEIRKSNNCPETIKSFMHIPPDEVKQKLPD